MKIINIPEKTVVYAANQREYLALPAYQFKTNPEEGRIAFCWKLTWRERLAVLLNGVLWHQVLTFKQPLQPVLLTVAKPDLTT